MMHFSEIGGYGAAVLAVLLYSILVAGDSASLTGGVVENAPPHRVGAYK